MGLLRFLAVLVVVAAVAVIIIERLPSQDSPFAPLDLDNPVGLATGFKLRRLRDSPAACGEAISHSSLVVRPLPDRRTGESCGFENVVAVSRSSLRWFEPLSLTCAMAAAFYVWEREVVAPAAAHHLSSRVVAIDHLGTYACRRVTGSNASTGRPSQHATTNAIDVAGFRLADGTRVTLARDWAGDDPQRRAFLREVRDGSCRLFTAVLSPDYNTAHADHFHLDLGPYRICR